MKKLLLAFYLISLFVISAQRGYACDCGQQWLTAWGEMQSSDAVFAGRVIDIRRVKVPARDDGTFFYEQEVKLKVQKVLKGIEDTEVVLRTGAGTGGDCGVGFKKGKKYLVYAYSNKEGILRTNSCTRTKLLIYAAPDLKEIEAGVEVSE